MKTSAVHGYPLYPFAVPIYSVFFYFWHSMVATNFLWTIQPILIGLIITGGIYGVLAYALKKYPDRAAVATYLLVSSLFLYGSYVDALQRHLNGHINPLVFTLLLDLILTVAIVRTLQPNKQLSEALTALNVISVVFVICMATVSKGTFETSKPKLEAYTKPATQESEPQTKPDIYVLVVDDYAGNNELKTLYNYDNQPFLEELRSKNFYVADASTTNYPGSLQALTAAFNLDYLPTDVPGSTQKSQTDQGEMLGAILEDNRLTKTLQELGYQTSQISSWWNFTAQNAFVDQDIYPAKDYLYLQPYTFRYFFDSTPFLGPILDRLATPRQADIVNSQVASIKQIVQTPSTVPREIFAHFILPHGPVIYDKDCTALPSATIDKTPMTDTNYLIQLQCTNQMLLNLVATIQNKSTQPPVIMVVSDEGSADVLDVRPQSDQWSKREMQEEFSNLTAVYYPNQNYSQLSPTISLVNVFRDMLKTNLGVATPQLEDKNFLFKDYYKFDTEIDVTDQVKKLF